MTSAVTFALPFTPTVLTVGLTTGVIGLFYMFYKKRGKADYPPIYAGWIPWFGCAFEFGRNPLSFIEQKRKELGPVYTLYVANERLTFVCDREGQEQFFESQNVDFQKGVQPTVKKVCGMPKDLFYQNHSIMHDFVKGSLAPSKLGSFTEKIHKLFTKHIMKVGQTGEGDLSDFVRSTMYPGVMDNFYGANVLPTENKDDFKLFERHFVNFDNQFEYGAKLPGFLLRSFSESKHWLLQLIEQVVENVKEEETSDSQTFFQSLIQKCSGMASTYFGLMFLWASLANAIPMTFWTLCFVLDNPSVLTKLVNEIRTSFSTPSGNVIGNYEETLKRMPYLKCCVLEAIRLRPPGVIVRRVVKAFTVGGYTIPKGDLLLVSPFWSHRNVEYFPDPEKYNPDRWKTTDLDKNQFLEGFISFGGGRYQCPGRWFALMEIQMYIAILLSRYDCQLLGDVPDISRQHLVGTQQPVSPCPFRYSIISNQ